MNTQATIEQDYDYVANLYTHLQGMSELKNMLGFERSSEDMVGTFFYMLGETHYIYINPCVASYLCGEELDESIQVSLVNIEGELISDLHVEFRVTRNLEEDGNNYLSVVRDVLQLIALKV